MKIFNNVADMKLARLATGQIVKTKGYYTPNDGGGAEYLIVATGTGIDDGGSYHDLALNQAQLVVKGDVNVKQFGAISDASTDNLTYFQKVINSTFSKIVFTKGIYHLSDTLNLSSDKTFIFEEGSSIVFTGDSTSYVVDTSSLSNVVIDGLNLTTQSGLAGFSSLRFVSCNNFVIKNCKIEKSGSVAIAMVGCEDFLVDNCVFENNYRYGIEDKLGVNNKFTNCVYRGNGSTGSATSTGGRGITLWMTKHCIVQNSVFIDNNEYGYRIYSEIGDAETSQDNILRDCYFENNGKLDVYLYDESGTSTFIFNTKITNCSVRRTTNPTLGSSFSLSGTDNEILNCSIVKEGDFGSFAGYNMFEGVRSSVVNSSVKNTSVFGSFSGASNCLFDTCKAIGVAQAISSSTGDGGNVTRNCYFLHGGTGTTDVAIANFLFTATEPESYIGNTFEDFHTGIAINEESVVIRDNISINSTLGGLRNYGDSFVGQEILGNIWDSTAPAILSSLQKDSSPLSKATLYNTSFPTVYTWEVGDRCFNSSPSVGQPKSWVCTVAGTSGTWVSEGNL